MIKKKNNKLKDKLNIIRKNNKSVFNLIITKYNIRKSILVKIINQNYQNFKKIMKAIFISVKL